MAEKKMEASEISEALGEMFLPVWQTMMEKLAESGIAAYGGDVQEIHSAVGETAYDAVVLLHTVGYTALLFAGMHDMPEGTWKKLSEEMQRKLKLGEDLSDFMPEPPGVLVCYDAAQWERLGREFGEYLV